MVAFMSQQGSHSDRWADRHPSTASQYAPSAPPAPATHRDLHCYEAIDWDYVCKNTLLPTPIHLPEPTEDWSVPVPAWEELKRITKYPARPITLPPATEDWSNETYVTGTTEVTLPPATEDWSNETYVTSTTEVTLPPATEDWSDETYITTEDWSSEAYITTTGYCTAEADPRIPSTIPTYITPVYRLAAELENATYVPNSWEDIPAEYTNPEIDPVRGWEQNDRHTILAQEPLTEETRQLALQSCPTLPDVQPYYTRTLRKKLQNKIAERN